MGYTQFTYSGPADKAPSEENIMKIMMHSNPDGSSGPVKENLEPLIKPIKRKAESKDLVESEPFDPLNEMNRLFDFLISFITCIIIVLLACKYMCVVLAPNNTLDDCQPSIYDLYVGIGALITFITIRLINIFKGKKHGTKR